MDIDEGHLIERVRSGEIEAYRLLVDAYTPQVTAYLASRIRDPMLVQDLVQESFITAYQNLEKFERRSRFSTWLIGITRNKLLNHLRSTAQTKNRTEALRAELMMRMAPEVDGLHRADTAASLASLRQCMERLTPRIREVVAARYFENDSVRTISERLERSPDAVRAMLTRARQAMRTCISGGA